MSEQWLSIAEAAAVLKVHPRTIERRIASGRLESRRASDGQVQVQLDVPDFSASAEALGAVKDLADRQVDLATGSASAIVRLAQEATERTTHDLLIAREELTQSRRSIRLAWIGTGVLAGLLPALVMAAVSWGIRGVAQAQADVRMMSDRLSDTRTELVQTKSQTETLQSELQDARLAQSHAEGELSAFRNELAARRSTEASVEAAGPTTRPANLLARLAEAFAQTQQTP